MSEREDGSIEIVKRIKNPRREEIDISEENEIIKKDDEVSKQNNINKEDDFHFHEAIVYAYEKEYEEEKRKKFKFLFLTLLGIVTVGTIGYIGSNFLEKERIENSKNINNLIVENKKPKEVTPYIEELAIKKDSQNIEKDVIALLIAQKEASKKEKKSEEEQLQKEIVKEKKSEEEQLQKEIVKEKKSEEEQLQKEIVKEKKSEEEQLQKEIERELENREKQLQKKIVKENISKIEVVKKRPIVFKEKRRVIKYEPIMPKIYTVKRKDTLIDISKKFYGNPLEYKRIIRANRKLRKNSHVHFGEKIIIPRKDGKKRRRYILIEKGDTLALIAKEIYGDISEINRIVRANRSIRTKSSTLRVGQKIYIPRISI